LKSVIIISLAIVFGIGVGLSLNVSAEENLIPVWIKSTASFWVDDQIGDSEFISAIEFLINEKIIDIPKIRELEEKNKKLEEAIEASEIIKNIKEQYTPVTLSDKKPESIHTNYFTYNPDYEEIMFFTSFFDSDNNPVLANGNAKYEIFDKNNQTVKSGSFGINTDFTCYYFPFFDFNEAVVIFSIIPFELKNNSENTWEYYEIVLNVELDDGTYWDEFRFDFEIANDEEFQHVRDMPCH